MALFRDEMVIVWGVWREGRADVLCCCEGHVLISPKRIVPRFVDLTKEEVVDLWSLAQRVGPTLEEYLCADSLTLAIQDGPAAGQTVPHVHIHCLPRKFGDFKNNDDIYDEINENSKLLAR